MIFQTEANKKSTSYNLRHRVNSSVLLWAGQDSNLRPYPCKRYLSSNEIA